LGFTLGIERQIGRLWDVVSPNRTGVPVGPDGDRELFRWVTSGVTKTQTS
jgi:hypothetical protein